MQLTKVIETAANNCALIFGDFNYPSIDWENLDADNSSRYFLDLVTDSFLIQRLEKQRMATESGGDETGTRPGTRQAIPDPVQLEVVISLI